ncbi:Reticulocyte-binding 2 protein [Rutstroemia sp. NJR-2017a WRK4]|nr:Reticulocyte-binding 2 protein [Rutstroemia sp. NJR-2017a WRK4]
MCNLVSFIYKCGHEKSVEWVPPPGETALVCRHMSPLPRPLEDDCVDCIMEKEMQEQLLQENMEIASYCSSDTEAGEIKEEKPSPIVNPRSEPAITEAEIDNLIQEAHVTVQDQHRTRRELMEQRMRQERLEYERQEGIRQERLAYAMRHRRLSKRQQAAIAEEAEFDQRCAAVARIQRKREERKRKMKRDDEEEDRKVNAKIHRLMRENAERKKSMELVEAKETAKDREEMEILRLKDVKRREERNQTMEREERIQLYHCAFNHAVGVINFR